MSQQQNDRISFNTLTLLLGLFAVVSFAAVGAFSFFILRGTQRVQSAEAERERPQATLDPDIAQATLDAPTATAEAVLVEPSGRIIYTCFDGGSDDVCVMDGDGSNQSRLVEREGTDFYPSPAASVDSDLITFSSRSTGVFEIYTALLSEPEPIQITVDLVGNYAPEISPDGTQITFASEVNGRLDIYVIDVDGTNLTQITTHSGHDLDPTWSPDGSQIAFTSNRTGTNEIYIIDLQTREEVAVTSGSDQQSGGRLDWSPDGTLLGFYAGDRGDKNLFLVPTSCRNCGPDQYIQLTDGGNNKAPAFSPDGQWITFASNLDGDDNEVYIMRLDGSDVRQLTDSPRANWQPRWGP